MYKLSVLTDEPLATFVQRVSRCLQMAGPGLVLALSTPDPYLIRLLLQATAQLGIALFPLEPAMQADRRNALLLQAGCSTLLTDEAMRSLPPSVRRVELAALLDRAGNSDDEVPAARTDTQIRLIVATSGTAGLPQAVMLSEKNLQASAQAVSDAVGLTPGDCWLDCLPLYHIAGLAILYRCQLRDARVLLHEKFDAGRVWDDLQRYQVTHLSLVPAMLARLLEQAKGAPPPGCLRVVMVGGAALSADLALRARNTAWPLFLSYGMTETGSACMLAPVEEVTGCGDFVGSALPGFELAQCEDSGTLKVRGEAVMVGYANPRLDPGAGLDNGWFSTSDLGVWTAQGKVRVLGRADDMLVSGGRNIHPLEVENMLSACPGVQGIAVTARADPVWGDCLVALLEADVDAAFVEDWARRHLPPLLRPRIFIKVAVLPRNQMGKLQRSDLLALMDEKNVDR